MENIINVDKLRKQFGALRAVDDISFSVKKGERFAFLGPNGAGKSTTIKMLTTLLRPDGGEILLNGFNPVTQQDQARQSFGIVFQDPSLDIELTADENLAYHAVLYGVPRDVRQQRIEELLKIVDLWERRHELVKNFSGGMKRRLEIARGLLHHPAIFFLDEPTLGLDPQTRNQIWEYIRDLNQREATTVFFTTHYMEEAAKNADQIAIIDKGKIIARGTVAELLTKTKTDTLEDAFLELTGREIREEGAGNLDRARQSMRIRRGE